MMRAIVKKMLGPLLRRAYAIYGSKPRNYTYGNASVVVEPGVFAPFLTLSTKILLDFLSSKDLGQKKLLELGCGCGIISVFAAKKGALVTASDINPKAVEALRNNADAASANINVVQSDLFENVAGDFDIIVINPPYYADDPNNDAEKAFYCGKNFEYFEKLFSQLPNVGEIYMILSEDCEVEKIKAIAKNHQRTFEVVLEKKAFGERNYIFKIN